VLYSSYELGELSQWLSHDDSTINIAVTIAVIIVTVLSAARATCKYKLQTA